MPRIAGRSPAVLSQFDEALFGQLERAGEVPLSVQDRFMLAAIVHICISARTEARDIAPTWRAIIDAAKTLRAAIDDFGPMGFQHRLPIPGCDVEDHAPLRQYLCRIESYESWVSGIETRTPTKLGRRRDVAQDALLQNLLRLYEGAGGVISLSEWDDENHVAGPTAEFFRLIWDTIPLEHRPGIPPDDRHPGGTSSETFVRRARQINFVKVRRDRGESAIPDNFQRRDKFW